MTHLGLFEGMGGFSLAASWMGWETKAWCEWNPFCQKVLNYYFPDAEGHGDITTTDFKKYANTIDVLTGGFPCQPFSTSGEQNGENDERYLFPEMFRAVREISPKWIVAENVYGITSPKFKGVFTEIYSSLEAEGYEVQTYIIPASAVEGDHERYRVWFIANSNSARQQSKGKFENAIYSKKNENRKTSRSELLFRGEPLPHLYVHNDGLSENLVDITLSDWRTDANKSIGNSIVPQIAYEIFKAIEQVQ